MNLYDTIEVGLVMDKVKVEWGAPLPPVTRRKKRSKYTPIVEEFLTRPETTARVTIDDLKAQAIAAGLKTAINGLGVAEKVHVSNRSVEGVWLVKADAVVENRTAQG
jgi:hypothetical protein